MGKYEDEYKLLNTAQKAAVDTTEGPVLVIAGPGTGKTQLLSMRVANILKSRDVVPGNILCLTYTNKAAVNMKQRIIALAGQEGSKVLVKTFHSFAGEIMNLYPDKFWNAARLAVAPNSVQLEVIENIIGQLPLDNPLALKFAGQYTLINDIRRSIGLTKDAGLTPEKLRAIIEVNGAYIELVEPELIDILEPRLSNKSLPELQTKVQALPAQTIDENVYPLTSLTTVLMDGLDRAIELDAETGKAANTGLWKKRWIQTVAGQKGMFAERQRNKWWLELADVYESYREQMHERGFYDYSDMLVEVVAQLEQHPEILADVQERFNYVLIDEFQDTTPAQLRLAHLVATHYTKDDKPNIMVVGDDDQAIYKFSGAELNNMLGFKRRYPSVETIILTKNYRSSQEVLDCAERIITQAENRLVGQDSSLNKDLVAENPPAQPSIIKAVSYSSRELQHSEIARAIQKSYTPDKSMAVLARSHDSLIKMTSILQQLEVPVRYEQQSNVLDHEIVGQVYLIAQLMEAIKAGDSQLSNSIIHRIIRHPMWGIAPDMLWELAVANRRNDDWLQSLASSSDENIQAIGHWFMWLSQQSDSLPLSVTLEYLLGLRKTEEYCSPIHDYFMNGDTERTNQYFHSLSAIQLLRSLVHEFAKNTEPSLQELVRFIDINKTNGLIVADESPFITGEHAVQLLTVHKAKGLEFDEIYIVDAVDDNWKPGKGSRKPPANLPLQPPGDDLDDYVRLMYVALTRAKSSILLSAYYLNHAGKDVAVSPMVLSAFEAEQKDEKTQTKLVQILEENLRWPDLNAGQEKAILKARLETYSLSVTHLLNFLDLERGGPQYFKERNLLYLPEAKSVSMSYGTAMHAAMETAQNLINQDNFTLDAVVKDFSISLKSQQLTTPEYLRFNKKGEQTLKRLFQDYEYTLVKGSTPEQDMTDIHVGEARVRGKLDRIDVTEKSLAIIDYKTGRPLASFETKDKTKGLKAYKHKLQLIFYAMLASEHPAYSAYTAVEGQMVYVEAESLKELQRSYTPSPEEIERLKLLVQAVYAKIVAFELPDVSEYSPDLEGIIQFEQDLIDNAI